MSDSDEPAPYMHERMTVEDITRPVVAPPAVMTPCTVEMLGPAFAAGFMGYVIGVGRQLIFPKGARFRGLHASGWDSFKTFGFMSGSYSFALCVLKRIREKDDWVNHGMAGCASGLAIGYQAGPWSALSSCLSLGAMSAYLSRFQDDGAAHAAILPGPSCSRACAQSPHAHPRSARLGAAHACCDDCASAHADAPHPAVVISAALHLMGFRFGARCDGCSSAKPLGVSQVKFERGRARLPHRQVRVARTAPHPARSCESHRIEF